MAAKIVFVFTLIVLLRASVSLPVSLDVKTEQSTDSVPGRTTVLNSETILRLQENNKLAQSSSTETLPKAYSVKFEAYHARNKRDVMKPSALCPTDRYECMGHCLTEEQYEDCDDGSKGSDDYTAEK